MKVITIGNQLLVLVEFSDQSWSCWKLSLGTSDQRYRKMSESIILSACKGATLKWSTAKSSDIDR